MCLIIDEDFRVFESTQINNGRKVELGRVLLKEDSSALYVIKPFTSVDRVALEEEICWKLDTLL